MRDLWWRKILYLTKSSNVTVHIYSVISKSLGKGGMMWESGGESPRTSGGQVVNRNKAS